MDTRERCESLLAQALGPQARFREGQLEAIVATVDDHARVLVVQRTGWGKSLVYFLATRILRDRGSGPTLLISPLLSLMRDQLLMASRIGVRARTINSANFEEWDDVERALRAGEVDLLLVSPERLGNERFRERTLGLMDHAVGLFVVDEAHCISDWGHDFRPDYRRIGRLIQRLPPAVPLLATTATANNRVIADIGEQLGEDLVTIRGPLTRESLRLQVIDLPDQAQRLAWLAENLPQLRGSGIVYCLTVADCERVAEWLASRGIAVAAYYGPLETDERQVLEDRLRRNEVKALVATVALGMGFDKPDLGFVIHFQRPPSAIAYYQQIGRAGRELDDAAIVLLHGREDDEIANYFIATAFPREEDLRSVLGAIERSGGLTKSELAARINLSVTRIERCLKALELDEAISKDGPRYFRSANPWAPERDRIANVIAQRRFELERIRAFTHTDDCLMQFLAAELDDPAPESCGRCANCAGDFVSRTVNDDILLEAIAFLQGSFRLIKPRKRWPAGGVGAHTGQIPEELQADQGRALSIYGDAGWGRLVADAEDREHRFDQRLVEAAAQLVSNWQPDPSPAWVTAIPSLRTDLVSDFAQRLAHSLGLPYRESIVKVQEKPPQNEMANSVQQARNVIDAFEARSGEVADGPVLLVDDIVDSGWSMTVCAMLLRQAGSGAVYPLALAVATQARPPSSGAATEARASARTPAHRRS
jgi:ATP-dependent DNA helicase RecQ